MFDIPNSGLTSIQCAEQAPLYEAFHYLASQAALEELKNET
jgi:hypothetical protein